MPQAGDYRGRTAGKSCRPRWYSGNPARAPRVLIIKNDFLISEMLHDLVAELGYSVTKVAHRLPLAPKDGRACWRASLVRFPHRAEPHQHAIGAPVRFAPHVRPGKPEIDQTMAGQREWRIVERL